LPASLQATSTVKTIPTTAHVMACQHFPQTERSAQTCQAAFPQAGYIAC
jgi:hypothetical protein